LGCLGRHRRPALVWWLPFLAPGVMLGIALIFVLNRPPFIAFYQSGGIVVLGLTLRYLALGWTGAAQADQAVDPNLVDAALLEGAGSWQLFRLTYWPQAAPRLAAAWYVIYLLCLWDVETLVLIVPPGGETLALRAFNLLHYGHNAQVSGLCLMLLGLAVLPWGAWRLTRALWDHRGSFAVGPGAGFVFLLLAMASGLGGCAPGPAANQAPVRSEFFSRVQIIGSRGTGLGQFNKPRSVALDAQDNLYVVDMTGRVQKFSSAGEFLSFWQMPETDKGKPKGMTRDRAGQIVVVEPHYSRINHFSSPGTLIAQWGTAGTNVGQLAFPRGVAVNSHGEIYVSEYGVVERVQQFAASGKSCLASFGRPGRGPGEFNRPEGLGIDPQDRVCVADSCNHRIQIFARDGRFLADYGRPGSGRGELSYPYDVQTDAAGRQFVCEFGNSRIQIFSPAGLSLEILGGVGNGPGQFCNPWSVALDSTGNLYVADSGNHRVQKFIRKQP
jgi:streptogramin lyase